MSGPWRWRIQASWRVGDEARSYNPYFVDSEEQAETDRLEMIDTLWHFVGLVVTVDRVARAEADAEEARIAGEPTSPPTVWVSPDFRRPN